MNKFIRKQPLAFLVSAIIGIATVIIGTSVKAQIDPNPEKIATPKFTNAENADKFNLQTDGKPFKPNGLNQLNKLPKTRGVIGSDYTT
ncbi:MAG: hypothetical protein WBA41_28640 [Rivularia sp. (in: cyanobacteria)]